MENGSSQDDGEDVEQISRKRTCGQGDLVENNLPIGIIRADIEHIRIPIRVGQHVDSCGNDAAEQKERQGGEEPAPAFSAEPPNGTEKNQENEHKMPEKAVEGQSPVGMHQAAGFCQGHHSAQEAVVLQKGIESAGDSSVPGGLEQGEKQAQIHGDAAELERKIPPVIVSSVYYIV